MIIWLASYPRSGNTFVRSVLNRVFGLKTYSIYEEVRDIGSEAKFSEIVGHEELPGDFNFDAARQSQDIFLVKTHELAQASLQPEDKVIYLIRDGREATLSFYHHQQKFGDDQPSINEIIDGAPLGCTWAQHVRSWHNEANDEQMLWLQFEEFTAHPEVLIEQIGHFLEMPPSSTPAPSFVQLQKIAPHFFRSGQKDSYRTEMPEKERRYFSIVNGHTLQTFNYEYKFTFSSAADSALLLSYLSKHFDDLHSDSNILKHQNALRMQAIEHLVVKIQTNEQKLEKLSQIESLHADTAILKKENAHRIKAIDALEKCSGSLEKKNSYLKQAIQGLSKSIEGSTQELKSVHEALEAQDEQLGNQMKQHQGTAKHVGALQKRTCYLEVENLALKQATQELIKSIEGSTQELQAVHETLEAQDEQLGNQMIQHQVTAKHVDSLQKRTSYLEGENSTLKQATQEFIVRLEKTQKLTEKRLSDLTEELLQAKEHARGILSRLEKLENSTFRSRLKRLWLGPNADNAESTKN